jgi:hypothetical protein
MNLLDAMRAIARPNEAKLRDAMIGVAASPGLMRESDARRTLEALHEPAVFHKHGLGGYDQQLLKREWCIKYVNARRAVERAITEASFKVRHALYQQGFALIEGSKIELPPVH